MSIRLVGSEQLPSAPLNDIPGMLRKIADEMEAGTFVVPDTMLWVAYDPDGEVRLGCLGDNPNKCEVVGMLMLAQRVFTHEIGEPKRG